MKFTSFIKVPRNRRFDIEPRYYDPVKEEIEERTSRIKQEMDEGAKSYRSQISFERKTKPGVSSSFLQLMIAALLGVMMFGWLYYGNQVFYLLWVVVPIYLYFRLKKKPRRKQ